MRAVCTYPFWDKEANADRKKGDVFDVTEARLAEINSTEYGTLAAQVEEEAEPKPAAKTTRRKAPAKKQAEEA